MIIVFTGDGKGKTTAALGQAVRAMGRNKKVLMIQFIKGPWKSGEDDFGGKFNISKENFELKKMGLGFVGILGDKLPFEDHVRAAKDAFSYFAEEVEKDRAYLYILDEINVALSLGLLKIEEILPILKEFPKERLLLLTGRGAPNELVEIADLVTEMKELKHPYNNGELAKYAVEF